MRVVRDGAYASAVLDAELRRYPQLDARERALTTTLVYGSLRTRGALLARLHELAPRGLAGGDALVEAHLVVAAHQLLVLDRIPQFAAVDAAVGEIGEARGAKVGGFANALLRRLARGERLDYDAAVVNSAPAWLRQRLERVVGREEAHALLGGRGPQELSDTAPDRGQLGLRVRAGAKLPEWLADAPRGRAAPQARLVRAVGDPRRQPGWDDGVFVVQEEGSQVVALALGARPGERVLDACAGRGQKASLLAEQVGDAGQLWAADLHPNKLEALQDEFQRLGLPAPQTAAVDWTAGPGSIPGGFDRVLVDAPCTGVGTLRRRPEIALRLGRRDPERLGVLSVQILRRAATRLRAGGHLVFAVCSVLPEECERVVDAVGDVLRPAPFDAPELAELAPPGSSSLRLLPLRHGTDGYFIASLVGA